MSLISIIKSSKFVDKYGNLFLKNHHTRLLGNHPDGAFAKKAKNSQFVQLATPS